MEKLEKGAKKASATEIGEGSGWVEGSTFNSILNYHWYRNDVG